jgi:hypothetical protein
VLAQLTQLRRLALSFYDDAEPDLSEDDDDEEEEEVVAAPASLPPAAVQALSRLTQLTSLELGQRLCSDAASSLTEALPRLARLRELQLRLHCPPALQRLIRGIAAGSLTQLHLSSPQHPLGSLKCLTQLTSLHLKERGSQQGGEPSRFALPAAFAHLPSFAFGSPYWSQRPFFLAVSSPGLRGGGAALGKLTTAGREAGGGAVPSTALTCPPCSSLQDAGITLRSCSFQDGKLAMKDMQQTPIFAQLLGCLVPRGCQVQSLSIDGTLPESVLLECCGLTALRTLQLDSRPSTSLKLEDAARPSCACST